MGVNAAASLFDSKSFLEVEEMCLCASTNRGVVAHGNGGSENKMVRRNCLDGAQSEKRICKTLHLMV